MERDFVAPAAVRPTVRVRVVFGKGLAVGPGKIDLLAAIDALGSIAAAGRSMKMSYQRAWSLIEELNAMFSEPLVTVSRGGAGRGGARLTSIGKTLLERYRAVERTTASICENELTDMAKLLK
jgi:molybdate transport system regulatory protein